MPFLSIANAGVDSIPSGKFEILHCARSDRATGQLYYTIWGQNHAYAKTFGFAALLARFLHLDYHVCYVQNHIDNFHWDERPLPCR